MSNKINVIEFAWKSGGGNGPSKQISLKQFITLCALKAKVFYKKF